MSRPHRSGSLGAPLARRLFVFGAPLALVACGFKLREPPEFAFRSLYTGLGEASPIGNELKRNLLGTGKVQVITDATQMNKADVLLDVPAELRERVIVGINAAGQARNVQLRLRVTFRLRTPQGKMLIPDVQLQLQREISYTDPAALAKQAEEELLYRDMQSDVVQQILRRLAAVRAL